jgi:hypothetical protein
VFDVDLLLMAKLIVLHIPRSVIIYFLICERYCVLLWDAVWSRISLKCFGVTVTNC